MSFGGGPTSPAVRAEIQAAFPTVGVNMGNGYGSSETVASVSGNTGMEYEREPTSAGRANPTCRIEIWDDDDQPVADGIEGRVVIQSAYNMLGYWQNPDATASAIRRDRFLDTGDIGRLEHGMLFINSRARDMIIRSGENIYPIEVESRVEAHPLVRECAVVGSDHPEHGQEVKAIVVPAAGATLDFAELGRFCAATMAPFKVPTVWEVRARAAAAQRVGQGVENRPRGRGRTTTRRPPRALSTRTRSTPSPSNGWYARDDGRGNVLVEAGNTVCDDRDPTAHAELNVARRAAAIIDRAGRGRLLPAGRAGAPGRRPASGTRSRHRASLQPSRPRARAVLGRRGPRSARRLLAHAGLTTGAAPICGRAHGTGHLS